MYNLDMDYEEMELKLLIIRQNLKDALDALLGQSEPISLKRFKEYRIKYELTGELLREHRERMFSKQRRENL